MLHTRPTSVAECDELLDRVQRARRECKALIRDFDDKILELESIRAALIPEQR